MVVDSSEGDKTSEMLYLEAYALLPRMPSEGLFLTTGQDPEASLNTGAHSCAFVVKEDLVVRLARRKIKVHGSVLRRGSTCRGAAWMCPVHVLGAWLDVLPQGCQSFTAVRADVVRATMRQRLVELGVKGAREYGLQAFRRGHAQDMTVAGCGLKAILDAGGWVSPAFLKTWRT